MSSEKELHLLNEIKSLKNEARLRDDLLRTKKSEIDKLNIKVEDLLKQTDNMEVLREQVRIVSINNIIYYYVILYTYYINIYIYIVCV